MPWSLRRYYNTGGLHFITCSCYNRAPLLNPPDRRDLLLAAIEQMRNHYQFAVVGYVIMPEHFHLLISEPLIENQSTAMQAIKLSFARKLQAQKNPAYSRRVPHFSRPLREVGTWTLNPPNHIWMRRFYDFNVWSQHKESEKIHYMHQNAVTRGLVKKPEDWPWSSFRFYASGEQGPVKINDWSAWEEKIKSKAS